MGSGSPVCISMAGAGAPRRAYARRGERRGKEDACRAPAIPRVLAIPFFCHRGKAGAGFSTVRYSFMPVVAMPSTKYFWKIV